MNVRQLKTELDQVPDQTPVVIIRAGDNQRGAILYRCRAMQFVAYAPLEGYLYFPDDLRQRDGPVLPVVVLEPVVNFVLEAANNERVA